MNWKIMIARGYRRWLIKKNSYLGKQRASKKWQMPQKVSLIDQVDALKSTDPNYFAWLMRHKLCRWQLFKQPGFVDKPLFAVIMPVYNTEVSWLKEAIVSVQNQYFGAWELIICDDASTAQPTLDSLSHVSSDARIQILHNTKNKGISYSTNRAVAKAKAPFLVFLDHDDRLDNQALWVLAQTVQNYPASVYYSDEDRLSAQGIRYKHHFKHGFSASALETHNYILHLMCIRKTAFKKMKEMRSHYDGSQDYDLLLRLLASGASFYHIPDILYSWGESQTSMVGQSADLKPEIFNSGQQALAGYFAQLGQAVDKIDNENGYYHVHFTLPKRLSILLIIQQSTYAPFFPPLPPLPAGLSVTVVYVDEADTALAKAKNHQLMIFMQAGLQVDDWMLFFQELAGWALRDTVGVVGGLVLDKRKHIIHAGLSWLPESKWQADNQGGYYPDTELAKRVRDYLAVSNLVLAISTTTYQQLRADLSWTNSVPWYIELCARAVQQELRVVYNPHALATISGHSAPWSLPDNAETQALFNHYGISHDPYFNPHLISEWKDSRLAPQLPVDPKHSENPPFPPQWADQQSIKPEAIQKTPLFTILLPVYNSKLDYLRIMLESIFHQTYTDFEVCISDDASSDSRIKTYLQETANTDSRFKLNFRQHQGGIARNTNDCLAMAKGQFIVFCDHDDELFPQALAKFANYIKARPDTELIYSDETMMDGDGNYYAPHHRPDWNPDMFTSQMYFPHLVALKRNLATQLGGMDATLEGSQDYDFHLRSTERAQHIGHVPEILYAWRCHDGSVAQDAASKLYAYEAGRKALQNAMERRGETATVNHASETALGVYRVKRCVKPCSVAHIIAVESEYTLTALPSIRRLAQQRAVETIVVISEQQKSLSDHIKRDYSDVKIITVADHANRATCYNAGAAATSNEQLIFSSDSIEIIDSDYPDALLEHSQRAEIGAVGCRLIYPNGNYYHTGLLLGVNEFCGYAHRNMWQGPGYWYYASLIRNYTAVSWDLMAVSKEHWQAVQGFDTQLSAFADVDFCLKLAQQNLRQVYTPYVRGVLKRKVHELAELQDEAAKQKLLARYGEGILEDVCYHPELSRAWEDFSLMQ